MAGSTATPVPPPAPSEPSVEAVDSNDGVDLTLIRWMLSLEPRKRLEAAQSMIDLAWVRQGGVVARDSTPRHHPGRVARLLLP